jgi:insertion element IS1 protein InsB
VGKLTFALMKVSQEVSCPHCCSVKIVKNGIKQTGKQNLLCRDCSLQFQLEYTYKGADRSIKALLVRMLLHGSGVRDCAAVLDISCGSVLRTIINEGLDLQIKAKHLHYNKVQIDEQWSYVQKKEKKVWMIYAVCAESGEILAASWGKRNKKNVKRLMLKLKHLKIDCYCTDDWKSFKEVLPKDKHLIGKEHTKKIEGINTWFRARLSRLVRRTTKFSKKLKYHYAIMKMAIVMRNQQASYI